MHSNKIMNIIFRKQKNTEKMAIWQWLSFGWLCMVFKKCVCLLTWGWSGLHNRIACIKFFNAACLPERFRCRQSPEKNVGIATWQASQKLSWLTKWYLRWLLTLDLIIGCPGVAVVRLSDLATDLQWPTLHGQVSANVMMWKQLYPSKAGATKHSFFRPPLPLVPAAVGPRATSHTSNLTQLDSILKCHILQFESS